ncbi:uncharacterized protein LOC132554127 [Ylistrum balloti]|uniref:uncharacterized protein LOC132554127 n=1 Tax=Ylistrum balloti TaxID=509963 RepID=UPI002905D645|nr:uncharacterized protein LOC132554127 [Ylistrum balloti]
MASPGEGNGNQDRKLKLDIENAGHVQVADEAVIVSTQGSTKPKISYECRMAQKEENRPGKQTQWDININKATTVQQSKFAMADISPTGPRSKSPEGVEKSTDTSFDGMYVRGHSMGFGENLHFCYQDGPNILQIANCCTFIEIDINKELVQNICDQGCLTVEVPLSNSRSLITFKWGSLQMEREYIQCEILAKVKTRLQCADIYNLEKGLVESLLCNKDNQVEEIVTHFFKNYKAYLLEIVNGSLVFKFLVHDVKAKDTLYSPKSLSRIAEFLEKVLVTNTIRQKAGCQQVFFQVTPNQECFRARPNVNHIFQFDTSINRESSPILTEGFLARLIQRIVSQELQASLSEIQASLSHTVARTLSLEMQKILESRETMSRDEVVMTSITSPEHHSLEPESVLPDGSSTRARTETPPQPRPKLEHALQDRSNSGKQNAFPKEHARASVVPDNSSTEAENKFSDFPELGQRSALPDRLNTGTAFQDHLSMSSGNVLSDNPRTKSQPTVPDSPCMEPHMDLSTDVLSVTSSTFCKQERGDANQGLSGGREDSDCTQWSFACLLFHQEDREKLWPDQAERSKVEEVFQLTENGDPLDVDTLQAVRCVQKMVDMRRLAELMSKRIIGGSSKHHVPGLHTVLCLDVSDSVKGEAFQKMVECAEKLHDGIEDNTEIYLEECVGVVVFGGDVKIILLPTNDYTDLEETIENLKTDGETSPLLEGIIASLLLLFGTDNVCEKYPPCLNPRIILMSDGLTTDGGQTEGIDTITAEVSDVISISLPMLLRASHNKCSISCVQFGRKEQTTVSSMMINLSQETGGDIVDPTQIQWLSNYYRRQNAIGKVLGWYSEKKEESTDGIKKIIEQELKDSKIDDKREQEQVEREVFMMIDMGKENEATGSQRENLQVSQPVLKPGDKVRIGSEWRGLQPEKSRFIPSGNSGTVINFNPTDGTVKVKLSNGSQDYFRQRDVQLLEAAESRRKRGGMLNIQGDGDLQVDSALGIDSDDDQSFRGIEEDHHNIFSMPSGTENASGECVTEVTDSE